MSRPPVGSTGTLAELQVEPGDVVECITIMDGLPGMGGILTIDARGYAVNANIDAFTPRGDVNFGRAYRLISRANPDRPAHIVTHEGRDYDLYTLETPFGILKEKAPTVAKALQAWPHGRVVFSGVDWVEPDIIRWECTYRAKPAPTETRVRCYRSASTGPFNEYGTCIKRPDGSIDWQSWRDAE